MDPRRVSGSSGGTRASSGISGPGAAAQPLGVPACGASAGEGGRRRFTRGLLELLAPTRCLGCRARAALPWCPRCAVEVRAAPPGCDRCAAPRGGSHACWPDDAPIARTIAAFDYRGPVAASVVTAKLAGAGAGWEPLAALLAARVSQVGSDADVVTWVTTPAERVRSRGRDHAAVLARAVAVALQRPALRLLDVQVVGGRDRYRCRRTLPGTNVVLVDDVVTTGATAWRAAAELRARGAGRVELAVLARAGMHPLGAAPRPKAYEPAVGGRWRRRR